MVHEFVEHRDHYSTVPVSVVDFEYDYDQRPMANFCCAPFKPDPAVRMVFGTHMHDSLELLYIREGSMHMEVNRERISLQTGDVMVVNPFDTHGGRMCPGDTHVSYACLMLELKPFMLEYKNNCSDLTISMLLEGEYRFPAVIRREEMAAQRIAELIESLQVDYNRAMEQVNPMLECRLMSGVYGLLALLMEQVYPVSGTVPNHHDAAFIRSINQYVAEHYAEALTAKKICAELGYGERNFYRLFRQNFAATFIDYLREFRIQRAAIDYRNSGLPVPEIAAAVGFTDYCYFSRSFKSIIGMTPARYFKQYSSR